jgi:hypothetical protein
LRDGISPHSVERLQQLRDVLAQIVYCVVDRGHSLIVVAAESTPVFTPNVK